VSHLTIVFMFVISQHMFHNIIIIIIIIIIYIIHMTPVIAVAYFVVGGPNDSQSKRLANVTLVLSFPPPPLSIPTYSSYIVTWLFEIE